MVTDLSLCVPYQHRQELVKRGAFDLDEDKVNFKSLLQRLMVELVAEESRNTEQRTKAVVDDAAAKMELAKQERERKKLEALERSKQRQADPEYFKRRTEQNEQAAAAREKAKEEAAALETVTAEDSTNEPEGEDAADDPFRSYKNKGRSKVFVK